MIYLLRERAKGPVKLGWASSPIRRLRNLQTGHSKPLTLLQATMGERDKEQLLHFALRSFRIRGEWYRPDPVVIDCLKHDRNALNKLHRLELTRLITEHGEASVAVLIGVSVDTAKRAALGKRLPFSTVRAIVAALDLETKKLYDLSKKRICKAEKISKVPDPLDLASLKSLRAMIGEIGEYAAADMMGILRATMCRAAAGVGIRPETAEMIRSRIEQWVAERAVEALKSGQ